MSYQSRLSASFRRKRSALLRDFIAGEAARRGLPKVRIIDVGGSLAFWKTVGLAFLREKRVHLTIVNHHESEFKPDSSFADADYIVGDARELQFADNEFDIAHSNSVVEHVGAFTDMMRFAGEIRRIAPAYYVQTPYFWFPVDPHFYRLPAVHWMPPPLQMALMSRFQLGFSAAAKDPEVAARLYESRQLLDRKQFRHLFPDGEHRFERASGLPKSMIAYRSSSAAH